jgi:hypothetical protein
VANIKVAVMNASTVLRDDQVQAVVPALQTQVHRDFAPVWGIDADLEFVPAGRNPDPGAWWLTVLDNSTQAGVLGFHDITNEGLPIGKVFAGTDIALGLEWTATASHELLEMLGDPDVNLVVFLQRDETTGTLLAYETCDACEADQFGYQINGSLMSDFLFPAWFESFRQPGSTQFDHGQHIREPFALLPGGYTLAFDVRSGSGWQQIFAAGTPPRAELRPKVGSRRERRRTPRNQWNHSRPFEEIYERRQRLGRDR